MSKSAFPDPANALSDPPGLIAVGGDLTIERLTDAYRHGIFPWFEAGQPILWWTPPTRAVIETSTFTRLGVCVNGFAAHRFEWS